MTSIRSTGKVILMIYLPVRLQEPETSALLLSVTYSYSVQPEGKINRFHVGSYNVSNPIVRASHTSVRRTLTCILFTYTLTLTNTPLQLQDLGILQGKKPQNFFSSVFCCLIPQGGILFHVPFDF